MLTAVGSLVGQPLSAEPGVALETVLIPDSAWLNLLLLDDSQAWQPVSRKDRDRLCASPQFKGHRPTQTYPCWILCLGFHSGDWCAPGTIALDAHTAILTLCVFLFISFPFGVATAATIRVGNLLGGGRPQQARIAGATLPLHLSMLRLYNAADTHPELCHCCSCLSLASAAKQLWIEESGKCQRLRCISVCTSA